MYLYGEEQHFYGMTVITVGHVPSLPPWFCRLCTIASYNNYAKSHVPWPLNSINFPQDNLLQILTNVVSICDPA